MDLGSAAKDGNNRRSDSERIFQAAMMEFGNGSYNYDNKKDKNLATGVLGWFGIKYGGLTSGDQEKAMKALFGTGVVVRNSKNTIVKELKNRAGQLTYVTLEWGSGSHAVVADKIENGRVYFRNPWGSYAATGSEQKNPTRRIEDSSLGLESMTLAEFEKCVEQCYLPTSGSRIGGGGS